MLEDLRRACDRIETYQAAKDALQECILAHRDRGAVVEAGPLEAVVLTYDPLGYSPDEIERVLGSDAMARLRLECPRSRARMVHVFERRSDRSSAA